MALCLPILRNVPIDSRHKCDILVTMLFYEVSDLLHFEIVVNNNFRALNPVQFGYENCAPSHSYGPGLRTYWLIHYVVSGSGIFRINGQTHHLHAGELFVIPPQTEIYYCADEKDPWNYIWIGFTTDQILPLKLEPTIYCPEAQSIFERMKLCRHYENGRSAFLCSCLWDLMSALMEKRQKSADPIEKALHCIHAEYMNGLTVSELAKRLNLERTYFSALFKRKLGLSPQQYLLQLRMETAAKLLTEQGERPTTAAISVGYTDLFNFSRMFKRYFGISPRAYIEEHR